MTPIIVLENIEKTYTLMNTQYRILHSLSLSIMKGDFIAIMGQSGSGKSTLMNIIGMLDTPTSGRYFFENTSIEHLHEDELTYIRRKKIGFVFQQYNLLPRMSAEKQVRLPLMYQGVSNEEQKQKALMALDTVGLLAKSQNKPNELSGGQQQRVSIARALVSDPEIILADEPTGALDSKTGEEVMKLLQELHARGKTIILITHEQEVAAYARRVIHLSDGNIISQS